MHDELDFAMRRVSVMGAGRTGQALVRFLACQHAKIFVSDAQPIPRHLKAEWTPWEVNWEEGEHSTRILDADFIIPSPGIAADHPIINAALARQIPVLSEIEVAYRHCASSKILAITGTVGKTTTTHLISELLKSHQHHVITAGNIGMPFTACLEKITPETFVVLEVSSYQLEHLDQFKPHVGVFTRFAPHHLHRHGSCENYFQIKCNLFRNQSSSDFAIVHEQIDLPKQIAAKIIRFSAHDIVLNNRALPRHQRENLAAALLTAQQVDPSITLESLALDHVLDLPHRIEYVTDVGGVRFYNDSKATSPEATEAALEALHERSLVLILGGQDSEGDAIELIRNIIQSGIERVLLVGQTRDRFERLFTHFGFSRFQAVRDISEAIAISLKIKPKICLFSPGSPSFDQFKNYEERGEFFKTVLRGLAAKTPITHSSDQVSASL